MCKEVLFVGSSNPLEQYTAGLGGWGGIPLAVCLGSWRNLWRRKWYHQHCCGVYNDRTDGAGRWYVFGFTPGRDIGELKRDLSDALVALRQGQSVLGIDDMAEELGKHPSYEDHARAIRSSKTDAERLKAEIAVVLAKLERDEDDLDDDGDGD